MRETGIETNGFAAAHIQLVKRRKRRQLSEAGEAKFFHCPDKLSRSRLSAERSGDSPPPVPSPIGLTYMRRMHERMSLKRRMKKKKQQKKTTNKKRKERKKTPSSFLRCRPISQEGDDY